MKKALLISELMLLLFFLSGCMSTELLRELNTPGKYTADSKQKFLKVHINDGSLFILDDWQIDTVTEIISGTGKYYNYKRDKIQANKKKYGSFENDVYNICREDISLIETNVLMGHSNNIMAISIVGVPLSVLGIYCLTNPKACFGSCPTFYTRNYGKWELVAEGFSSSILPSFEKQDIDMLYRTTSDKNVLPVKLTNEALETHVIRYASLLAFPHREERRIFSTQQGDFFSVKNLQPLTYCMDKNGDCLEQTAQLDNIERYGPTDSKNLAKKEELIFSFDNSTGEDKGLIISTRQTLLTTYLFYQGLAYSGNFAGRFAAEIENGSRRLKKGVENLWGKLGGIEIYLKTSRGKWKRIETIEEMGPIATDIHLVKLPDNIPHGATFKLKMTQGLWRIDYIALGNIEEEVTPIVIQPETIFKEEEENPEALKLLTDTLQYLITYPGDSYIINYKLPGKEKYEFFLQSKGYYLEWMRDEWLAEQNLNKARFMFAFPGLFMRAAAKEFKKTEADMENHFWGSRYVHK